jgi:hypothetical protein
MTEDKASHACSTCKRSHRRCDRALPYCGGCKHKGKSCSYDELPNKPGPKNAVAEPLPVAVPTTPNFAPIYDIPVVLDQLLDNIILITPLVGLTQAHHLVAHRRALKNNTIHELEVVPNNQDLALVYSLQGLFLVITMI